jgi:hypothetical protein
VRVFACMCRLHGCAAAWRLRASHVCQCALGRELLCAHGVPACVHVMPAYLRARARTAMPHTHTINLQSILRVFPLPPPSTSSLLRRPRPTSSPSQLSSSSSPLFARLPPASPTLPACSFSSSSATSSLCFQMGSCFLKHIIED